MSYGSTTDHLYSFYGCDALSIGCDALSSGCDALSMDVMHFSGWNVKAMDQVSLMDCNCQVDGLKVTVDECLCAAETEKGQ